LVTARARAVEYRKSFLSHLRRESGGNFNGSAAQVAKENAGAVDGSRCTTLGDENNPYENRPYRTGTLSVRPSADLEVYGVNEIPNYIYITYK